MYQYEFFDKKNYNKHNVDEGPLPDTFIKGEDIVWVRPSYWAEHCLECGEPLCYSTCERFSSRPDGRCRRFAFGMYDTDRFPDAIFHAEVLFRAWGKTESIVYPGVLTVQQAHDYDREWNAKSIEKRKQMGLGPIGRKRYPIADRQEFDSSKYKFSETVAKDNIQETPTFLLQLYSYEQESFTLFFDITDDEDLVFHDGLAIEPGYNQFIIDVSKIFPSKGKLRAKFYPADDYEANVVFLFSEFVQLKDGVSKQVADGAAVESASRKDEVPAAKVKCVAWDLDNTLWDGILIESDPDDLELRPGILETMKALDERGIIQVVVSKNNVDEALPVLKRLQVEPLLVSWFINWGPKSASLQKAAKTIGIGMDTFALVDDSPFERAEVSETLPMVRTYDETMAIGAEDADGARQQAPLLGLPEFDVPQTSDGHRRREMYRIEAQRNAAAEDGSDNAIDFLRSCEIKAYLSHPVTEDEKLRSYELIQRTNQLNLSGHRYDKDEFFGRLDDHGDNCFIVKCEDRFGAYGQVLYMETSINRDSHTVEIREFAMSCRVARKCVEAALARTLLELYQGEGATSIELIGTRTSRNSLLIESFTTAGFVDESDDARILLRLESQSQLIDDDVVDFTVMESN